MLKLDRNIAVIEGTLRKWGHSYIIRIPSSVGELLYGARVIVTIERIDGNKTKNDNYISGDELVKCVDECNGLTGEKGDMCVKRCLGVA